MRALRNNCCAISLLVHSRQISRIISTSLSEKDGRSAEAWAIYVRLLDESDSAWIDVDVLDAMRLHLQRDGQAERAIDFGIAHRVARVSLYREMKREAEEALNGPMPESMKTFSRGSNLWERQRVHHRSTVESPPSGSLISPIQPTLPIP